MVNTSPEQAQHTGRPSEPRMPSRVRLARPDLWRDETTGQLRPDVRDAYLGLATLADDVGYLLWRPAAIGAALYPYVPARRREADLAHRADALQRAGLLVVNECGCGHLPRMDRDLAPKGGDHSTAIADYHAGHSATDDYVALRSNQSRDSGSGSGSGSVSDSWSPSGLGEPVTLRARARERSRQTATIESRDGAA